MTGRRERRQLWHSGREALEEEATMKHPLRGAAALAPRLDDMGKCKRQKRSEITNVETEPRRIQKVEAAVVQAFCSQLQPNPK